MHMCRKNRGFAAILYKRTDREALLYVLKTYSPTVNGARIECDIRFESSSLWRTLVSTVPYNYENAEYDTDGYLSVFAKALVEGSYY